MVAYATPPMEEHRKNKQKTTTHRRFHLSRRVLGLSLEVNGGGVLHDPLHGHLDELIEGVELLANQPLLVEVGADDDPAGLLPQLRGHILAVVLLIVLCKHHSALVIHCTVYILANSTVHSLYTLTSVVTSSLSSS